MSSDISFAYRTLNAINAGMISGMGFIICFHLNKKITAIKEACLANDTLKEKSFTKPLDNMSVCLNDASDLFAALFVINAVVYFAGLYLSVPERIYFI